MADDGGLTAILGVVTIKLHTDTIKALMIERIEQTNLPVAEKSKLRSRLEKLSDAGLTEAGKFLMRKELEDLPNVVQWLGMLL